MEYPKGWSKFFNMNEDIIEHILKKLPIINKNYFPKDEEIFNVFYNTKFKDIKVVILGQDPYPDKNQAMGLAFSTNNGTIPLSLNNIYNNLEKTVEGWKRPKHGNLIKWSKEGVFLLNTALTYSTKEDQKKHLMLWKGFIEEVFDKLSKKNNIVYILWGFNAQKFLKFIDIENNKILCSSHPSPLSVNKGFSNSNHFNETNQYLIKHNKKPIDWNLD